MADALDWVTLDEAKQAVNMTSTVHDVEFAAYITAVSRRLDELFGAAVIRTVTGEVHDGGTSEITLDYRPVAAVTTVTEYSGTTATVLTAETNAARPTEAYLLDRRWGTLIRRTSGTDASFPDGRRNVVVDYTAGRFANTAAVDPKFKLAAQITLANLWRREQGGGTATFGAYGEDNVALGIPTFGIPNVVADLLGGEAAPPVLA